MDAAESLQLTAQLLLCFVEQGRMGRIRPTARREWAKTYQPGTFCFGGCALQRGEKLLGGAAETGSGCRATRSAFPVLKPDQQHIETGPVAHQHTLRVEELLEDLIVGRELDHVFQSQIPEPELERFAQRLRCECSRNSNSGFGSWRLPFDDSCFSER